MGETGSIHGIQLENLTAGNLLAAATRNLADNLTRCATQLAPGHTWKQVRLSGGLSRDLPLLKAIIQARFPSATLIESTEQEETLAGLATMATVGG